MSLMQFWQIVAAGRWLILAAVFGCLAAALIAASQLPPTYESRARVMLELVRPDPITGKTFSEYETEPYVQTQQILITGDRVAGAVVDKLGWATAPGIIDAWQQSTGGFGDIRQWAAQRIAGATYARPLEGSATLEIVYRAPDPDAAETIVRLVRASYVETALAMQTEAAQANADRYDRLAEAARLALVAADAAVTATARATGTIIEPGGDLDKRALATQAQATEPLRQRVIQDASRPGLVVAGMGLVMTLRHAIGDIDTQLDQQAGALGASNPVTLDLESRRAALRRQLSAAEAAARGARGALMTTARDLLARPEADYQAARAKLLANGPGALNLAQEQRIAELRRAEYGRLTTTAARQHLLAERTESGLVIMGDAITDRKPVSPDIPVIAGIAAVLGFGIGICAAILNGLIGREVLGAEDLEFAAGVPVLGVLPRGPRLPGALRRWLAARRAATA